jgi:hypothetical protein
LRPAAAGFKRIFAARLAAAERQRIVGESNVRLAAQQQTGQQQAGGGEKRQQ